MFPFDDVITTYHVHLVAPLLSHPAWKSGIVDQNIQPAEILGSNENGCNHDNHGI